MMVKQIVAHLLESGNMRWKRLVTDQDFSDEIQFMLYGISPEELKGMTQVNFYRTTPKEIYSLRDSENVPYVTALYDIAHRNLETVTGPENAGYPEEAVPYIKQLAKELGATKVDFSRRGRPIAKRKYAHGWGSAYMLQRDAEGDWAATSPTFHPFNPKMNFANQDQVQKEIDRLLDVYNKASDQEKPEIERQIKELSPKAESKARQVVAALLHEQDNVDDPQSFVNNFQSPPWNRLPPLQQYMLDLDVALTGKDPNRVASQYHHYPRTVEKWMLEPGGNPMWYLSDSGYSRVVWNYEDHKLFLTSGSRQEVVDRWEAAAPQRQALLDYLVSEWNRLGEQQS